jgi:hypothetical protein
LSRVHPSPESDGPLCRAHGKTRPFASSLGLRLAAVAAIVAAAAWIHVGSAFAAGYPSPWYTGKTGFGNFAPVALPPISLGTGKYPDLLVDAGAGLPDRR